MVHEAKAAELGWGRANHQRCNEIAVSPVGSLVSTPASGSPSFAPSDTRTNYLNKNQLNCAVTRYWECSTDWTRERFLQREGRSKVSEAIDGSKLNSWLIVTGHLCSVYFVALFQFLVCFHRLTWH